MAQSQDLALIYVKAQEIVDVLNANPWPNCGRIVKGKFDYCRQRMVLITLGWMGRNEYEMTGKTPSNTKGAKPTAIERLQRALVEDGANIKVDNDWGAATSGALARTLQNALRQSIPIDMPDKSDIPAADQRASQNTEGSPASPGLPRGPRLPAKKPFLQAALPWLIPVGLIGAAAATWAFYRFGKKQGLQGCPCALGGHDHAHDEDEEEALDPQTKEIVEGLRQIPAFRAPRPQGLKKGQPKAN